MGYISIGSEKLYYRQTGTGANVLLVFHGYGETSGAFDNYERYLGHAYTILSFDLPHHGQSLWTKDKQLTTADLLTLLTAIKTMFAAGKVSLLGYSLGGRVCLAMAACAPDSIAQIVLAAPDGLRINPYYYFLTRTAPGKWLFRHMLYRPQLYFSILRLLKQLRIIDASRYKFVMRSLKSNRDRMFLLQVWPCMSDLLISSSQIRGIINQYRISVIIFMGAYDKVIPPALGRKFARGMETVQLHILGKGHRLSDNECAALIAKQLL